MLQFNYDKIMYNLTVIRLTAYSNIISQVVFQVTILGLHFRSINRVLAFKNIKVHLKICVHYLPCV